MGFSPEKIEKACLAVIDLASEAALHNFSPSRLAENLEMYRGDVTKLLQTLKTMGDEIDLHWLEKVGKIRKATRVELAPKSILQCSPGVLCGKAGIRMPNGDVLILEEKIVIERHDHKSHAGEWLVLQPPNWIAELFPNIEEELCSYLDKWENPKAHRRPQKHDVSWNFTGKGLRNLHFEANGEYAWRLMRNELRKGVNPNPPASP
jgi:hypothetical protein